LLTRLEANVRAAACIIELEFLDGRSRIDIPIETLVNYSS
jgi:adenine/guanine phosphoribosyltransferase-like PRPP-binding protein